MDEGSLEVGTVVGDRYSVEALVGLGGLAEVYRVRHLELGSVHALKLLTWNRKSLTERLLLEGRIQAQLTHPHIVRVTDVVRLDHRVGLLLEFVEGPSLDEFIEHHGGLGTQNALGLFAPVLAAVAHAHDAGVLHRDLKPANVLLVRSPGAWVPKVTDFGLAKVVEEGLGPQTRTGISMGTPGYMPPEQIRNSASADPRTDIFALGTLLYEMICGRKAFEAPDGGEIELTATIDRTPVPLTDVEPEVWEALERAMSRDRERRFADARSFAEALGIAGHPSLRASPDLVGVPLALDPSTYPSSPSGEPIGSAERTMPTIDTGPRRVPGPVVVGLVLGSVLASVVVTALLTQPVLESRRAQQSARRADPPAATPSSDEVPRTPTEDAPSATVSTARPDDAGESVEAVDPPRPEPKVLPEAPASDAAASFRSGGDEATADAATDAEAAGTPERDTGGTAAEAPDDGTRGASPVEAPDALPDAPLDATIEEPPPEEPQPPFEVLAVGRYEGQADRVPFELRVWDSTGGRVVAEAVFLQGGSGPPRREKLEGTFDPTTRALRLESVSSQLVFEGRKDGATLSGEYRRGSGRAQRWRVVLR